jgi:hypothetical protein
MRSASPAVTSSGAHRPPLTVLVLDLDTGLVIRQPETFGLDEFTGLPGDVELPHQRGPMTRPDPRSTIARSPENAAECRSENAISSTGM